MKLAFAATLIISTIAFFAAGAQAVIGPAMPTNLEQVVATQTTMTFAWGPTQPGDAKPVDMGANWLVMGWGASLDNRSAVTYTVSKDGKVLASGLTGTSYRIGGLSGKVKTFHTCVTAQNAKGQSSPPQCTTWNRQ